MVIGGLVGIVICLVGCGSQQGGRKPCPAPEAISADWMEAGRNQRSPAPAGGGSASGRYRIAQVIVRCKTLIGRDRRDVVKLLRRPDALEPGNSADILWVYSLGASPTSVFDPASLNLTFRGDDRVRSVFIDNG